MDGRKRRTGRERRTGKENRPEQEITDGQKRRLKSNFSPGLKGHISAAKAVPGYRISKRRFTDCKLRKEAG